DSHSPFADLLTQLEGANDCAGFLACQRPGHVDRLSDRRRRRLEKTRVPLVQLQKQTDSHVQRAVISADVSQVIGATLRGFNLRGDLEDGLFVERLDRHESLSAE